MIYIGIDPGASGGIAVINDMVRSGEPGYARCEPYPATERDTWLVFRDLPSRYSAAAIEKVAAMPGQGVSGMFRFGQNYGFLRACLTAANLPFREVAPRVWQKEFGLPTKEVAGSITAKKNAHKARAQQLFPHLRVTHAVADALLIAEWLRRKGGVE